MDWMRRRKKALLVMAALASLSAGARISSAEKQMPPEVRQNPAVVQVEKQMKHHAAKGDIHKVEKDAKKLKKVAEKVSEECTGSVCKINIDNNHLPEFVSSGDLEKLHETAGKYFDGEASQEDVQKAITDFKANYGHDVDALMEARGVQEMVDDFQAKKA